MIPSLTINLVRKDSSACRTNGRNRIGVLYRLAAAVLIPLGVIIVWALTAPNSTSKEIMGKYGYLDIVPPSTLHAPGTFNTVERLGEDSVQLHPVCKVDSEALSELTMTSETVDSVLRKRLSGSFKAKLLKKLKSSLSGEQVKDVQLSLRNMRILLLTDEDLYELQEKYLKGSCEKAIIHNIEHGAEVCQAKAVIQADMVYRVFYTNSIGSEQQATVAEEIGASVESIVAHQGNNEYKGDGLYYGVRLSRDCLVTPNRGQKIGGKTTL